MKTIVVDFDGTLIRKNSFPNWIKFVLKSAINSFKFQIFFSVLSLLLRRKVLKNITHLEFKRRVDSLNYPSDWAKQFLKNLKASLSPKVYEAIENERRNDTRSLIVSTAAPECYARYIPEVFFEKQNILCVCSRHQEGQGYFNNFQANKAASLEELLESEPGFILFTDHSDDYELAKRCDFFYLCNPNETDLQFFMKMGISYKLVQDR